MACGLPVVTTVCGTNHEIVVPPNERVVDDAGALAEALLGLLADPARRAAVGAAQPPVRRARTTSWTSSVPGWAPP